MTSFLKEKKTCKDRLLKKISISSKKALVAVILDSELSKKNRQSFQGLIDGCHNLDVDLVVLSDEKPSKTSKNLHHLQYNRKNRHDLIAAADMAIAFRFSDLEEMLIHGTIPIAPKCTSIADYNPNSESGHAFVYNKKNAWAIFAALVRAVETFKFPYDWKNLMKQGVASVQTSQSA